MIKSDMLYVLEELKSELKWTDHAYRKARKEGLKITLFSGNNYVLGKDAIEFITKNELKAIDENIHKVKEGVDELKEKTEQINGEAQ